MNKEEVKRLDRVEIEVRNNTKQLEKIVTNDLPHIKATQDTILGKMSILKPFIIGIAVGEILLIFGLVASFIIGG